MIDFILHDGLTTAIGIALGYALRRPLPPERINVPVITERIKTVEVPKVIVQEAVRVEYVEKPVIVDRPSVELVEIERERIVEKPVIERVAVPMGSAPLAVPDAVDVVLMDASEQHVHATAKIDARLRRSMITANDQKYQCSKQDECGRWIYRQVTH